MGLWLCDTDQSMWQWQLNKVEQTICISWLLYLTLEYNWTELSQNIQQVTGAEVALQFQTIRDKRSKQEDKQAWIWFQALHIEVVSTFTQVFSPRPDSTFVEFMAWSLFGFPSGPLPVYVPFSTKETAETAGIMASSAITQNITGPTVSPVSVARSWNQRLQQLAPRFNCPMASLAIAGHRLPSLPIFWTML